MILAGYVSVLPRPRGRFVWFGLAAGGILLGVALWFSAIAMGLSVTEFLRGLPWMLDFLGRLVPPNVTVLPRLVGPAVETVQIAVWGTLFAVGLALPLAFLAARNLTPNPLLLFVIRGTFNVARGINELILALLFVAAVGLGPFPGVLALAVHGSGMLGKFFADAIEEADHGPIEALQATGASRLQVLAFAVVPQVLPAWISVSLYRLEANIRQAAIVGMVGAGGIGFELVASMRLLQYQDTAMCIVVIIAMVTASEMLSSRLRRSIHGRRD